MSYHPDIIRAFEARVGLGIDTLLPLVREPDLIFQEGCRWTTSNGDQILSVGIARSEIHVPKLRAWSYHIAGLYKIDGTQAIFAAFSDPDFRAKHGLVRPEAAASATTKSYCELLRDYEKIKTRGDSDSMCKLDSTRPHLHDTVELTEDWPQPPLAKGTLGAVVHLYASGNGCEVEVVDSAGNTLHCATLPFSVLRIVTRAPRTTPWVELKEASDAYVRAKTLTAIDEAKAKCDAHLSDLAASIPEVTPLGDAPSGALLPCPFCASAAIDPHGWRSDADSGPECENCGAKAPSAAAWNTRPAPPASLVDAPNAPPPRNPTPDPLPRALARLSRPWEPVA